MARDSKQKIIDSGLTLFSGSSFDAVSVAALCRAAEVANGLFYFYYSSKEEFFISLLEEYYHYLEERLSLIPSGSPASGLEKFIDTLATLQGKNRKYLAVYHQGRFLYPVYEERLLGLFRRNLERILGGPLGEVEFAYLIAGIRFTLYRSLSTGLPFPKESIFKLIRTGVFNIPVVKYSRIFSPEIRQLVLLKDDTPKGRLLEKGIELFCRSGFSGVSVAEIARAAGLSVGSFYHYYSGKEEIAYQVIGQISWRVRKFINKNIGLRLSRIEQELRGMFLFYNYFKNHPDQYRIIRLAEFVVPDAAKEYYDRFEAGYLKNLKDIQIEDRASIANFLMGIAHYLGLKFAGIQGVDDPALFLKRIAEPLAGGVRIDFL